MRKKTLVRLTVAGWILYFLGFFSALTSTAAISLTGVAIIGSVLGILLMLAAIVVMIIVWIRILTVQAKHEQWAWFACTILFNWIAMILYLIIVPEMPQPVRPAYTPMYPPVSLYQPMPPYQTYSPLPHNPSEE